jgi:NitT/TauT family transport system permease protein
VAEAQRAGQGTSPRAPARVPGSQRDWPVIAWRLLILAVLLGAWQWLTGIKAVSKTPGLYWIDPFFISRPSLIAERFLYLMSDKVRLPLWQMALSTVQSTLWGFLVGISTGFVAGLALGRRDRLARVFEPYIIAFNSLPRIALVPLITMIFGFGLLAKIVLAWTIVFFIVFFNTFQGARSVDADLVHSARFLGAGEGQIMRTVIIPSTLAWTFASLTPSISFALIGVVVGEFIGGESGGGLGYLIIQSLGTLNAADMMVALLVLGLIGIVMALGIKQVETRLLRWRPEYQKR